jgi:aryl-alcohol dehydrogenase-like predicted oxidoreductase
MDKRPLGRSGIAASALGLGCNAFGSRTDLEASRAVVHAALDEGVTLFDTADGYGRPFGTSEDMLGDILKGHDGEYLFATKGGANPAGWSEPPNASRAWLMQALEDSLRRLKIDCIDLYQLHFPDPKTPIEETLRAMDDMVRQGKVGAIGCSNFSAPAIREAAAAASANGLARFETTQAEYHLLARNEASDVLDALDDLGMSLLPYFPLAGGLLTGKYRTDASPEGSRFAREPHMGQRFALPDNLARVDRLAELAIRHGISLPDLAIGWLLARPAVGSVIAGATSAAQVRANAASARMRIAPELLHAIEDALAEPA